MTTEIQNLLQVLETTSKVMNRTAIHMTSFENDYSEIYKHGLEMFGAVKILNSWVDGIKNKQDHEMNKKSIDADIINADDIKLTVIHKNKELTIVKIMCYSNGTPNLIHVIDDKYQDCFIKASEAKFKIEYKNGTRQAQGRHKAGGSYGSKSTMG